MNGCVHGGTGYRGGRFRVGPVSAVVLALVAVSCGGGDKGALSTSSNGGATPAAPTTTTDGRGTVAATSSTGVRQNTSTTVEGSAGNTTSSSPPGQQGAGGSSGGGSTLLQRRDAPPPGVAGQFAPRAGAGSYPCMERGSRPTGIVVASGSVSGYGALCFDGFALNLPIDVRVDFPNGRTNRYVVPADPGSGPGPFDDSPVFRWYVQPGDPPGNYTVAGTQQTARATGTFTVTPVTERRIFIVPADQIPPAEGRRGTTFVATIFGFPPNAPIEFYLYGQPPGTETAAFVTIVRTQADGAGQRRFELATSAADPVGRYCVVLPDRARSPDPGGDGTCINADPWSDTFTLT